MKIVSILFDAAHSTFTNNNSTVQYKPSKKIRNAPAKKHSNCCLFLDNKYSLNVSGDIFLKTIVQMVCNSLKSTRLNISQQARKKSQFFLYYEFTFGHFFFHSFENNWVYVKSMARKWTLLSEIVRTVVFKHLYTPQICLLNSTEWKPFFINSIYLHRNNKSS